MMFPDDSRAIESLAKVPFIAAFVLNVVSAIPAEEYRSSADEVPATIFPSVWIANEIIEVVIVGNEPSTVPSALYLFKPKVPATTNLPSLCTFIALTVAPGLVVKVVSRTLAVLYLFKPNAPPTKTKFTPATV